MGDFVPQTTLKAMTRKMINIHRRKKEAATPGGMAEAVMSGCSDVIALSTNLLSNFSS